MCVCIQTHISELFMCTQTQINQAKDQFPASTKTPKLMRSLSECSEAQCTAPACSWIQEYLQSCIAKKCYEQFTQNQLNKHNHALETSSSTKCIFCSLPAACISSVCLTTHTLKDPTNPNPLTLSQDYGQAPCHAGVQLRQAALLSQHSPPRKAPCA